MTAELHCPTCRHDVLIEACITGDPPACGQCGTPLILTKPAVFGCPDCGVRSQPALIDLSKQQACPKCRTVLHLVINDTIPRAGSSPSSASSAPTLQMTADAQRTIATDLNRPAPAEEGKPTGGSDTVTLATHGMVQQPSTIGLKAGQSFGKYGIRRELARGGMGVVFVAEDPGLRRDVALKILIAAELAGEEAIQRFLREARAAAALRHPNIVPVHDAGVIDGLHFYTMDLVRGKELGDFIGQTPLDRMLGWIEDICRALAFAHDQGVIHRDLKPGNIMVNQDGRPLLMDFGLARDDKATEQLSMTGQVFGTPAYMSPEQAQGRKDLDHRSDVYAMGAILYEIVTGHRAFEGATVFDTIQQVIKVDPLEPVKVDPDIDPQLSAIIMRCLAKEPDERYVDMLALASDLQRFRGGAAISGGGPGAVQLHWRQLKKKPVLLGALIGTPLLLCLLIAVWVLAGEDFVGRMATEVRSGNERRAEPALELLRARLRAGELVEDEARILQLCWHSLEHYQGPAHTLALDIIGFRPDAASIPVLLAAWQNAETPELAVGYLSALDHLADVADEQRPAVQEALAQALRQRPLPPATGLPVVASTIAWADQDLTRRLEETVEDRELDTEIRLAALQGLASEARLHHPAMFVLLRLCGDADDAVAEAAAAAVDQARSRTSYFALYGRQGAAGQAADKLAEVQRLQREQMRQIEALFGDQSQPRDAQASDDPVVFMSTALTQAAKSEQRIAAATDLGRLDQAAGIEPLTRALGDQHPAVRAAARRSLVKLSRHGVPVGPIAELLGNPDPSLRTNAARLLGQLEDRTAVPALGSALAQEQQALVQVALMRALAAIGDPRGVDPLRDRLDSLASAEAEVCIACLASNQAFDGQAAEVLVAQLDQASKRRRDAAHRALVALAGTDHGPTAAAWQSWLQEQTGAE